MATSGTTNFSPEITDTFYAYLHCTPDGLPFYVGKGKGRRARIFWGRSLRHRNKVAKYGKQNILIGEIVCSSEKIAFDLEVGLIKCLRRAGVKLCNFTDGGEGASGRVQRAEELAKRKAFRHTEESKAKMRGRVKTTEERAKLSAAAKVRGISEAARQAAIEARRTKVRKHSEETRRKISEAAKKRGMPLATILAGIAATRGRTFSHSEETKRKLSLLAKARVPSEEQKSRLRDFAAQSKKRVQNEASGEVYESAKAAAEFFGVTTAAISYACRKGSSVRGIAVRYV